MMEQIRNPRYDIYINAGMCLDYAEKVFSIDSFELPTAWSAWEAAKRKHKDRNFPAGMSVPIFFDWMGDLFDGAGMQEYGHAAVRDKSGRIYSSPLTGYGFAWFESIDDLVDAFGGGMEYVGWTEDLSGYDVIKENDVSKVGDTEIDQMSWVYFGYGASQEFIKEWRGTESNTFERMIFDHPVAISYRKQITEWRKQADSGGGEFKPYSGAQLYIKK